MARPRATRWRSPPESFAGLRSSSGSMLSSFAVSRAFSFASALDMPATVRPKVMFCSAVMWG